MFQSVCLALVFVFLGHLKQAQLRWARALAYGAMHQNQIQLRVKFWCIPRSTAQCGIYSPIRQGGTLKGPLSVHSHKRTRPIGQGGTPKGPSSVHSHIRTCPIGQGAHPTGHRPVTLTYEPAPLGRGAHPKGHCPSTLTNEPAPSGRGSSGARRFGNFEWRAAALGQPLSS